MSKAIFKLFSFITMYSLFFIPFVVGAEIVNGIHTFLELLLFFVLALIGWTLLLTFRDSMFSIGAEAISNE